jgi:hypothetical protein
VSIEERLESWTELRMALEKMDDRRRVDEKERALGKRADV